MEFLVRTITWLGHAIRAPWMNLGPDHIFAARILISHLSLSDARSMPSLRTMTTMIERLYDYSVAACLLIWCLTVLVLQLGDKICVLTSRLGFGCIFCSLEIDEAYTHFADHHQQQARTVFRIIFSLLTLAYELMTFALIGTKLFDRFSPPA